MPATEIKMATIPSSIQQQKAMINCLLDRIEGNQQRDTLDLRNIHAIYKLANDIYSQFGLDPSCSILGDIRILETLWKQGSDLLLSLSFSNHDQNVTKALRQEIRKFRKSTKLGQTQSCSSLRTTSYSNPITCSIDQNGVRSC